MAIPTHSRIAVAVFPWPEPDRDPYQNGEHEEAKRIVRASHRLAALEDNQCNQAEQGKGHAYFQKLRATPVDRIARCPENDSWRNDQNTDGITQPPDYSNRTVPLPLCVPSEGETCDTEVTLTVVLSTAARSTKLSVSRC